MICNKITYQNMIVTLYAENYMSQVILPEVCNGQFWLNEVDEKKKEHEFIEIDGIDGSWYIKDNQKVKWDNSENGLLKITENIEIIGNANVSNEKYIVRVISNNDLSNEYERFSVKENSTISLGRGKENDIVVMDEKIAKTQISLRWNGSSWTYKKNTDSKVGVYVNSKKSENQQLVIGDCLSVFDCKILLGVGFFAINNPEDKLSITPGKFEKFISSTVDSTEHNGVFQEETEEDLFYPSPRFKRDIETATFKIDPPPQNQIGEEMPIMMVIGPSMTMGMASLTSAIFAINNAMSTGNISGAIPSIVMSGSMVLGTVMWPVITKKYERKRRRKKEAIRQEKYKNYIYEMESKVDEVKKLQKSIREETYIDIDKCIDRIVNVRRNLWERNHNQNDFLEFRVGRGDVNLDSEFKYSERRFTLEEDNLQNIMLDFCEAPKILKNVPVTISLFKDIVTGIIGQEKKRREFLNGLIFQIVSLYSYEEVKLIFIKSEDSLDYVKWLPHVWDDEKKVRFIAQNQKDMKDISIVLEKVFEERAAMNEEDREDVMPHYIIICEDKKLAKHAEIIRKICSCKDNYGFSILCNYPELKNLPKECSQIVELGLDGAQIFDKNDTTGKNQPFNPDIYMRDNTLKLSKQLSRIILDKSDDRKKLPKVISFLEMCNVGRIEHLNIVSRWQNNNPVNSLGTTVGVDELGEEFKIDLHEKVHGPHGLVAGMTGSGKSEFIMTYILSMAINYHPNEVAFILIDYKGGGMAKSFENLPHTAGIITNLDGSAIKRSLVSIESELKRRQAIFANVSKQFGISNIDIYKYQKLYREGNVSEPLQHLFIISDEFAELKTQQPDFMAKLISAARIGRSLGVHLILATQKPAGVVDDQIWSNSRFRVCLKVQEKADSMDMLKRPDAAELVDTGRFYLQVGYNEIFQIGQSAWAGAPYYPSDQVWKDTDDSVEIIDNVGRVLQSAKYDKRKALHPNPDKQLDAITDYLQKIAEEENIHIRSLWLPPLDENMSIRQLREKYNIQKEKGFLLEPIIGEIDDPEQQRQAVLRLPLSTDGNVAIFGNSGSGKTTLLMTMIYSLMEEHTPEEVQFYIMDFASETLRIFHEAPHVGEVILSHEEEKIENVFKLLKATLDERKKMFRDFEGDFVSFNENSDKAIPALVVIIHNYTAFYELYEEKDDAVSYLTREGSKYGIYFILTSVAVNGIRFRLLQNISRQVVLQLNDASDFSVIFGKTDGLYPAKYKGRGLISLDKLYEFQTCSVVSGESSHEYIRNYCKGYKENWSGITAKRIAILPENVNSDYFLDEIGQVDQWMIPIGVDVENLEVKRTDFSQSYISLVVGISEGYLGFMKGLCRLLIQSGKKDVVVFDLEDKLKQQWPDDWNVVNQPSLCEDTMKDLFEMVKERNNTYKETDDVAALVETWSEVCIIIVSLNPIKDALSDMGKEMLGLLLEKGCAEYKMFVILADNLRKLQTVRYESWYKQHITGTDGIWIGNGISDQYLLQINQNADVARDDISDFYGFIVTNGKAEKLKVLTEEEQHG